MSVKTWDLETSTKTSYKRKANPFDPDNYVVVSGWKAKDSPECHFDYFGRNPPPKDWFTKLLDGTTILVGQNIKFDLLYALRDPDNHKAWMKWVAAGGLVWDIQLAEYLLQGMIRSAHMLSLDELAPRYGGNVKFDEVKALWEAGVDTIDIPVDLIRKYLIGDESGHGDIGNTELVFIGQLETARATGQVKSILLNMGSLICTVEMELNGMAVDLEEGERKAEELALKLVDLGLELNQSLPADLPFPFNWGSGPQKSALLFGGTVGYSVQEPMWKSGYIGPARDGEEPLYYLKEETHHVTVYGQTAREPDGGFSDAEKSRLVVYKTGKNAGEYKTKKVMVDDVERGQKLRWVDKTYDFPRMTEPSPTWAGKVPGVYSTSGEVIEALGNRDIPFLKSLAKVTGLRKDLTTYYVVTDPETGERTGMLTLVQADGIIHHMLNHTSTVTGRFSSSNPNLQNIPSKAKSEVKKLFKSRFKGGSIVQSDFSSLEVYVQAILTKCSQLIADLKAGLDMHCNRVAQKEGITYDEAVRLCKTEAIKEWVEKRRGAKEFSFQRAYGAGAAAIALSTGMPQEEVEALAAAEDATYPEVPAFYVALTKSVEDTATPTKLYDHHPDVPGALVNFKTGYYRTPDNKLYRWTEGFTPKWLATRKGGKLASFSPTEIKNYPVQGTGGEWAKAAMWLAVRAFYARENFGGLALLVNQVHDALYTDTDESVRVASAALLHACMEQASTFMEWYFDWEQPLPVPSDTTYGSSMYEERKFDDPDFKPLIEQNTAYLRATYMNNFTPSFERH